MKRLGYLATPYTHPDPAIKKQRFEDAAYIAAQLMTMGKHVISPISMCHPMAVSRGGLPGTFAFWSEFDENLIARCDYLALAKLPGWLHSDGMRAEVTIARSRHKEILVVNITPHLKVLGYQPYKGELDG